MNTTVIILSWNGKAYLSDCLKSVAAQTRPADQIIVVDNDSSDGSADFVAQNFPQVELIRNTRNVGFAAGNNIGLRAARGDVLVLLNQDTEVRSDWLEKLVAAMEADATIGIAGCKILYPDGTLQHGGAVIKWPRGYSHHLSWHEADTGQCDAAFDADFVTGAALAISRAALERIGPLDEGFAPAYYEDVDWCYRARAAGLRVRYMPEAALVHYESASRGRWLAFVFHRNRVRFVLKHCPAEKIQEFESQEAAWLDNLEAGAEESMTALRRAYLDNLLALGDLGRWRQRLGLAGDAGDLATVLVRLREACDTFRFWTRPQAPADATVPRRAEVLNDLHASWALKEQPFHSDAPLVGPAIAGLRDAFNNISTRWYVLPLVKQQTEFNANVTTMLVALEASLARSVESLNDLGTRQNQEAKELRRELAVLAERLLALERRLDQDGK